MGVLIPRRHMVSLRLTEVEYNDLVELAAAQGAHSTSDLARVAICEFLDKHKEASDNHRGPEAELRLRVVQLQGEIRRLSRQLNGPHSEAGVGAKG